MATKEQFDALATRFSAALDVITSDLTAIKGSIAGKGMSEEDENAALAGIDSLVSKLEGIAKDNAPAAPPTETPSANG